MDTARQQLDTRVRVVTPENIAFQYHVAGPFRRLSAYVIDLAIRAAVAYGVVTGLSAISKLLGLESVGDCVAVLIFFVLTWFYGGLFETFWNGQTPGKRLMRLRVLSVEGQAINASQAVLRNVLRAVDTLPVFYVLGLISATMNDRFQRLGDLACGTMVVVEDPHWLQGVAGVAEPAVLELTARVPGWFQPERSLARALAMYVGRRLSFTVSRRAQIARYVGVPLRERLGFPQPTNLDHLLCALYNRTFVGDDRRDASDLPAGVVAPQAADGESPFAAAATGATGILPPGATGISPPGATGILPPGATGILPVGSPHGQDARGTGPFATN